MRRFVKLKRKFCLLLLAYFPFPHFIRIKLITMGGVKLKDPKDVSIGQTIKIDTMYPDNIYIGKHVHITIGVSILTHTLDTSRDGICWKQNHVVVEDGCFIGTNTIICNDVTIGRNSIVGAGSVVTKNIPPNEIWAGNPARFIKKRVINE